MTFRSRAFAVFRGGALSFSLQVARAAAPLTIGLNVNLRCAVCPA